MRVAGLWLYPERVDRFPDLQRAIECLAGSGMDFYTLPEMAYNLPCAAVLPEEEFYQAVEIMITLGGDGTVLGAARACAPHGIPILGVNLGHKGFLTGAEIDTFPQALRAILEDRFTVEERMMLKADSSLCRGEALPPVYALNDMLLSGSEPMSMIRAEAHADGASVGFFECDGLLVSTPTGSTAYNLSAGGPVIGPGTEVMLMTPLHAHSMRSVPLVLSADTQVVLTYKSHGEGLLMADGRVQARLCRDEAVRVSRAPFTAKLITMYPGQFYQLLYKKLS